MTDAPKRYDLDQPTCHMGSAEMREDPLGDWVRFDEVQALIAEAVERATRVKPLVWERHPMGWIAGAMFGPAYIIDIRVKGRLMFVKGINPSPQLDDIEAAKAAAQADYEQRIRAAIGGNDE
jgi:hypothetical protein